MFVPNAGSMGFSGCLICLSKSTDRVQAPFQVIPRRKSFRQACVKRSLFAPHQPEARADRASLATGKPQKVGSVNIVDHGVRIGVTGRSEEHTSELQSRLHLVCRLLLEKK